MSCPRPLRSRAPRALLPLASAVVLASAAVAACSDPPPVDPASAFDAGVDAPFTFGVDVPSSLDAGAELPAPDGAPLADGTSDASPGLDAKPDTGPAPDTGTDAGTDAAPDTAKDTATDAVVDTAADVPSPCGTCPADRPVCDGTTCVCQEGSCAGGMYCSPAGTCQPCGGADPDHCGPTCAVCGGATPACVAGVCACGSDPDCDTGHWCDGGACKPCDTPLHCGDSCAPCGGGTPVCASGQCRCNSTSCPAGQTCDGTSCATCGDDDPDHCGQGCEVCTGTDQPVCEGGQCVCTDSAQCGAGAQCVGGACDPCDTDDACGPACGVCGAGSYCGGPEAGCVTCDTAAACGADCAACGGATPYCAPDASGCVACDTAAACGPSCQPCPGDKPLCMAGAGGDPETCVQCLDDAPCDASTEHCDLPTHTCVPNCQVEGCWTDTGPSAKTCSQAEIVGRTAAEVGIHSNLSMSWSDGNDDDLPSGLGSECWDAKYDQFYRIYLLAGETLSVSLTQVDWDFDPMMKLYKGTQCKTNWETDLIGCYQSGYDGGDESLSYVAETDGWYTIVIDGRHASDPGEGPFTLNVSLACNDAGCCCL